MAHALMIKFASPAAITALSQPAEGFQNTVCATAVSETSLFTSPTTRETLPRPMETARPPQLVVTSTVTIAGSSSVYVAVMRPVAAWRERERVVTDALDEITKLNSIAAANESLLAKFMLLSPFIMEVEAVRGTRRRAW